MEKPSPEDDMKDYGQELSGIEKPTIDDIIAISMNYVPEKFRNAPWMNTGHGIRIYENDGELACYIAAYGEMHKRKMEKILDDFPYEDIDAPFEIVDWGCGQGLATICLIDRLREKGLLSRLRSVTLVEPSCVAIARAETNIRAQLRGNPGIRISLHKACLPGLVPHRNVYCHHKVGQRISVNLFSNILDVPGIDLKSLATMVAGTGLRQYLLCVGPVNSTHDRINAFTRYFRIAGFFSDFISAQYGMTRTGKCFGCISKGFQIVREDGKPVLVPLSFYPPKQFFAGYILDEVEECLAGNETRTELLSGLMRFEVLAPFDIGASIYEDVHPVLAVLNNIVTRGLPAKASPFIQETVAAVFRSSVKEERNGAFRYAAARPGLPEEDTRLLYIPVAVARLQKVILEALMTGSLELKDRWKVIVKEDGIPCSALAFRDLQLMFDHLCALSQEYDSLKFPEVDLTIICEAGENVGLALGYPVCSYIDKDIAEAEYDMAIDFSMNRYADPGRVSFSEFSNVSNGCYFNVRSSREEYDSRKIYTSGKITYKEICHKNDGGDYVTDDAVAGHLEYFLHLLFRKIEFRPGQLPILSRALQNRNVIGLLPTGGGKSLTYQLAAMLQPGVTIVIDPLVSLMKDQYDGLLKNRIDFCTFINGQLPAQERARREFNMETSRVLFVFLSPERLCIYNFRKRLDNMHETNIYFSYGVIDEVHCVSEWGHDFRTSYLHLGRNLYNYVHPRDGRIVLFGLTATASFDVLADVERELSGNGAFPLDPDTTVRYENTNRLELQYYVYPVNTSPGENKWDVNRRKNEAVPHLLSMMPDMLRVLQKPENTARIKKRFLERENIRDRRLVKMVMDRNLEADVSDDWYSPRPEYDAGAIIFCPHTSGSLGISDTGSSSGVSTSVSTLGCAVSTFKGGSSFSEQENFLEDRSPVMVATKAFGMGIDKPDVRFTINMSYSNSLESFVQEAGRAGRDRKMALAAIMYNEDFDRDVQDFFFSCSFKGERQEKAIMYSLLSRLDMSTAVEDREDYLAGEENSVRGFMDTLMNAREGQHIVAYISYDYHSESAKNVNRMLTRLGLDDFDKPVRDVRLKISRQVMYHGTDENDAERMYAKAMDKAKAAAAEDYLQAIAKAIYRMCCIGLIEDFTQDYLAQRFRIVTVRHEENYYKECLKEFLERYYTPERAAVEIGKVDSFKGENEIHKCLGFLTQFVYGKIAAKRKRAIMDIDAFCYNAVHSGKDWLETNEDLKDDIYFYFNSKYAREDYVTESGEPFSLTADTASGKISSFDILFKYLRVTDDDVVGASGSQKDNIRHLSGAVRLIRRSLTDENPTIDILNAFCLFFLGTDGNPVLEKELSDSYVRGWTGFWNRTDDKVAFYDCRAKFAAEMKRRNLIDRKQLAFIREWNTMIDLYVHSDWLAGWAGKYADDSAHDDRRQQEAVSRKNKGKKKQKI